MLGSNTEVEQSMRCVTNEPGFLSYEIRNVPKSVHADGSHFKISDVDKRSSNERSTNGHDVLELSEASKFERGGRRRRMRLSKPTEGATTVLVLRVIGLTSEPTLSRGEMSNYWFGTHGDEINAKSLIEDCSFGKLQVQPATGTGIVDGVGEVAINVETNGVSPYALENEISRKAQEAFGSVYRMVDHVAYCLPPGTIVRPHTQWTAYGYLGYYRSVFNDKACGYPSFQAHEMMHNYGLHHSNHGWKEYGDQQGLMGFSYKS